MNKFALIRHEKDGHSVTIDEDFVQMVMDVLVSQLGYKTTDARQMVADANEKRQHHCDG